MTNTSNPPLNDACQPRSIQPLLVAIIATCDRPQLLLNRALKSVVEQTKLPDLILVIDDSSEPYQSENKRNIAHLDTTPAAFTYLLNTRTPGASGAWNSALDYLCQLDTPADDILVAILDDDDEWTSDYLNTCYHQALTTSCDMVCTGFFRRDPHCDPTEARCLPPKQLLENLFYTGNPGIQGSNLFLRLGALMAAGGFDENLPSCTDRDLCIRLSELPELHYLPIFEPMVIHYADHSRNRLSTPGSTTKLNGLDQFWRKYQSRMNDSEKQRFAERAKQLFAWQVPPVQPPLAAPRTVPVPTSPSSTSAARVESTTSLTSKATCFNLHIGVIAGDAATLIPLIESVTPLIQHQNVKTLKVTVLCNGCSPESIMALIADNKLTNQHLELTLIDDERQQRDANKGLFGRTLLSTLLSRPLLSRPGGTVAIADARTMLQKYLGLACEDQADSLVWMLDDDMRLDSRANAYIQWFATYHATHALNQTCCADIFIGSYEGASPNPPLNGLRGQLVDLIHNIKWLRGLPENAVLPDKRGENHVLRHRYPDYYYDLSRKHTGHLETAFWLEPAFEDETVAHASSRLIRNAPLITSGFPLTRALKTPEPVEFSSLSVNSLADSVNRGGNTFIFNMAALVGTPNLIPSINNRALRRSDMAWAMINKHYRQMTIKAIPFPVKHQGRVSPLLFSGSDEWRKKVQDELMGSALYAGLQHYFSQTNDTPFPLEDAAIDDIWHRVSIARAERLQRLKQSVMRIAGLAKQLEVIAPELGDLAVNLQSTMTLATVAQIEQAVMGLTKQVVSEFLQSIPDICDEFAATHHTSL